jgi:hypothetical protein
LLVVEGAQPAAANLAPSSRGSGRRHCKNRLVHMACRQELTFCSQGFPGLPAAGRPGRGRRDGAASALQAKVSLISEPYQVRIIENCRVLSAWASVAPMALVTWFMAT